MTTALENRASAAYHNAAMAEVRNDFPKYFDALRQHPRMLVGKQVPSITGDGMETIRDSADAREWQDAVKQLLTEEANDRASRTAESNNSFMATLHQSVELFQRNNDLVPGTKEFDRELADAFVDLARPYEVRVDGKPHGWSVPVQPMVDQLRKQLVTKRAQAAVTPPAQGTPAKAAGTGQVAAGRAATPAATNQQPPPDDGPQEGITSKAGASADAEDFSALFGTIGLPTLRI